MTNILRSIPIIMHLTIFPIMITAHEISIIPRPVKVVDGKGVFSFNKNTSVVIEGDFKQLSAIASLCMDGICTCTGTEMVLKKIPITKKLKNVIILKLLKCNKDDDQEGYRLTVGTNRITVESIAPAGIFYGIQSLLQLIPKEKQGSEFAIPAVSIEDRPRFKWRGMHLDVSRHFFPKEFIKTYIDMLAMHKMNVFHWHLTDDQGWRIEIKKYPELTGVSAWRVDRENISEWNFRDGQRNGEKATYGGFYTQDEIKNIVQYAQKRFITIVPEIEMPGHTKAVLAAYPRFSCTGGPFTIPAGRYWPITDIYCAGNDSTFQFLQDVLNEVIALFPGKYIHIGGDEANHKEWKKCTKCQNRIKSEGLRDEQELQSYFIKRVEKFLKSKNRKLIGWDEILEGGLSPEATVMSWRGTRGGIAAAREGHDVVMTPGSHCYFDYYQGNTGLEPLAIGGYLPLSTVYSFEPVPDSLSTIEAKHVLGAQGNVWTEYIATPAHVQYMTLPRMAAMAEVVWSPKEERNWQDFSSRIENIMKQYEKRHWNYSKSAYQIMFHASIDSLNRKVNVALTVEVPSSTIHYTLDGSQPLPTSQVYDSPISIAQTGVIKAGSFKNEKLIGSVTEQQFVFHQASFKPVRLKNTYEGYKGDGVQALTNTLRATKFYGDKNWQGFRQKDFEAVIDLNETTDIRKISAGFLRNLRWGIFLPTEVEYAVSDDDLHYLVIGRFLTPLPQIIEADDIKEYSQVLVNGRARYIRVRAKNIGLCPQWHPSQGEPTWIYIDEIMVN